MCRFSLVQYLLLLIFTVLNILLRNTIIYFTRVVQCKYNYGTVKYNKSSVFLTLLVNLVYNNMLVYLHCTTDIFWISPLMTENITSQVYACKISFNPSNYECIALFLQWCASRKRGRCYSADSPVSLIRHWNSPSLSILNRIMGVKQKPRSYMNMYQADTLIWELPQCWFTGGSW